MLTVGALAAGAVGVHRPDPADELVAEQDQPLRIREHLGEQGALLLDGQAQQVTEGDGPADTTIKVSWDDWQAMSSGQLDGMTAFMMGKLKVEGDMSNAMQLQSVLSKLRS